MSNANGGEPTRYPYMRFFVDDWLSSDTVDNFTLEQEAVYLRLLLRQWRAKDGLLPKDELQLAKWTKLGKRWPKVGRPVLERKFQERVGGWVNLRCRAEWDRAKERAKRAAKAAAVRWEDDDHAPS